MKRYNLINNTLGWLCFLVAAATYLLTIEPTASFWDCPEFISQGAKLEVGHPPGNPIFMLAARFFVTLFGGIPNAAIAVNCMSALLSAGTILLLFWTITHLSRRLVVRDGSKEITPVQMLVIMGAGLCGALAYTWSDTFWFSAVEGEVYAFSSFCTALVFWLILKWENRADMPHSDRYLVLIAYVIGISIAVHLLNLLCIPAIGLVFYYRKFKNVNVKGSLIALGLSCVVIALILFGLVPGMMKVAQRFELVFVNGFGLSYNTGVLTYAVIIVAVMVWTVRELCRQRSAARIKIGFFLCVFLSGIPFIGHSVIIPLLISAGLLVYLWAFCPKVPVRVFNVIVLSLFVIFVGYSSYALLLIRANANTPMNQNGPDNVFALATYMSREQYGDTPLLKGPVFAEELVTVTDPRSGEIYVSVDEHGTPRTKVVSPYLRNYEGSVIDLGDTSYAPKVKHSPDEPDEYVKAVAKPDYRTSPSLDMFFTRIFSSKESDVTSYKGWSEYDQEYFAPIPQEVREEWAEYGYVPYMEVARYLRNMTPMDTRVDDQGNLAEPVMVWKPGFLTNLKYFVNYQLNHMYWRYFMWNFAGRQNDLAGNGEPHLGNWISGIPFIDNPRLGDQSLLPDEFGKGNKGHNVFYMLPLLLGLIGLLWQALGRTANEGRGIEQFWVIFFLFFMTGIAIVLYLNQVPGQPRERDYAFAGSFYAFAIWIGLGVPALAHYLGSLFSGSKKAPDADESPVASTGNGRIFAAVAVAVGIAVPLQMVSQTWDDHDRSGRYAARDFGMNYLNSIDPGGIIFTYGDNDTFPLWYAQEVEGVRTDARVINLSYLTTDWYANQMKHPYYDADGVKMYAQPTDYGYERIGWSFVSPYATSDTVDAEAGLKEFYGQVDVNDNLAPDDEKRMMKHYIYRISVDKQLAAERYGTAAAPDSSDIYASYPEDLVVKIGNPASGFSQASVLGLDIVANSFSDGQKHPVYFATTVPTSHYSMFSQYVYPTGMALEVTPYNGDTNIGINAEKGYANIMGKFAWGGLDKPNARDLYLDETVRRMVSSTRTGIAGVVRSLMDTADMPASEWAVKHATENNLPVPQTHADMARLLIETALSKLPADVSPLDPTSAVDFANTYYELYRITGNEKDLDAAEAIADAELPRFAAFAGYAASLDPYLLSHMTGLDNYHLHALSGLLGLKNRILLRRQLNNDPEADSRYKDIVDNVDFDVMTFYVGRWLYGMGYGDNELTSIYNTTSGEMRNMAEAAALFMALHEETGVDQMAVSEELASRAGFSLDALRRVYDMRLR